MAKVRARNAKQVSSYIDRKQLSNADRNLLKKFKAALIVSDGMTIEPKVEVAEIAYDKKYKNQIPNLADYLANVFLDDDVVVDTKKSTIRVSKINLKFSPKKEVTSGSGIVINTQVQEEGTTVILNQVLHYNKKFNKPEDIMNDDKGSNNTADKLRDVFKAYDDDKIEEWTHSYYEQQKEFLKEFQSSKWDIFRYDNQSFVKFFETHIRNKVLAREMKPLDLVKKYTEWNPSDIWAVYEMDKVKKQIDKNITPKTSNVMELNNLLINLFDDKKLIGLSLKKIAPNKKAKLKFVNITPANMKMAEIEKYKMKDIEFAVDNIFQGDAIATAVKFDNGTYKIDIGHAGSRSQAGNLNFNTFIRATPGARGGLAPIVMLMKLFKNKGGSGITFKNDHNKYPVSSEEFNKRTSSKYTTKDFEKYYKVVKPYFKKSQKYDEFEEHITNLYNEGGKGTYIAQTKLMMLHFFHDTLKNNSKNPEFWTDILYLGMKVGKDFAPHAKIS